MNRQSPSVAFAELLPIPHASHLGNRRGLAALVAAGAAFLISATAPVSAQAPGGIHSSVIFPQETRLTTSHYYLTSIATADFDNNGWLDVIDVSPSLVSWYPNTGNGVFGAQRTITSALRAPTCVATGDLDGDGRADAVVSSLLDDRVVWFRNTGNGNFDPVPRVLTATLDGAYSVTIANVDGDNLPDVLATGLYDRKVVWMKNLGAGNFGAENIVSMAALAPSSVKAQDLDDDGIVDLVVTSQTDNTVAWLKGSVGLNGARQFERFVISNTQLRATASAVVDLDGDGLPDVVCASPYGNAITWFRNTSRDVGAIAPYFGPGTTVSGIAYGAFSLAIADLNRDGRPDIVGALFGGNRVAWYQNLGLGEFAWNGLDPNGNQKLISTTAAAATAVATGDFNNDGLTDVVSGSQDDGKVAVYLNQGGQYAASSLDTAPAGITEGHRDDVLRVLVSNRGISGDHSARLETLGLLFEKSAGVPLTAAEANAVIGELHLYMDANGSNVFEQDGDSLVATLTDLALVDGRLDFQLPSNNSSLAQIPPGTTRSFFVVPEIAPNAALQNQKSFRVTHFSQGNGKSVVKDAVSGAALALEPAVNPDVASSLVTAQRATTFTDWAFIHFDSSTRAGTGLNESPLNDGVSNLLKYAFAINPLKNTGSSGLPQMKRENNKTVLRFRKPSSSTDLVYRFDISSDLVNWTAAIANVHYQENDQPLADGTVQADLTVLVNWPRTFMRAQVEVAN